MLSIIAIINDENGVLPSGLDDDESLCLFHTKSCMSTKRPAASQMPMGTICNGTTNQRHSVFATKPSQNAIGKIDISPNVAMNNNNVPDVVV